MGDSPPPPRHHFIVTPPASHPSSFTSHSVYRAHWRQFGKTWNRALSVLFLILKAVGPPRHISIVPFSPAQCLVRISNFEKLAFEANGIGLTAYWNRFATIFRIFIQKYKMFCLFFLFGSLVARALGLLGWFRWERRTQKPTEHKEANFFSHRSNHIYACY